jgi:hypothetical protein
VPKRSQNTTWKEFIEPIAVLAGIDFFTVEVLTWHGLVTYYVLFFIHREVPGSVRDAKQPALLSSVRCQGASDSEPQDHTTDP